MSMIIKEGLPALLAAVGTYGWMTAEEFRIRGGKEESLNLLERKILQIQRYVNRHNFLSSAAKVSYDAIKGNLILGTCGTSLLRNSMIISKDFIPGVSSFLLICTVLYLVRSCSHKYLPINIGRIVKPGIEIKRS